MWCPQLVLVWAQTFVVGVHLEEAASVMEFALTWVTVATMSGWFAHVSVMNAYTDREYL